MSIVPDPSPFNTSSSDAVVMKFGGTSLADAASFKRAADTIAACDADTTWIVVSAIAGITDALVAIASRIKRQQSLDENQLEAVLGPYHSVARQLGVRIDALQWQQQLNHAVQHYRHHPQIQPASLLAIGEYFSADLLAGLLKKRAPVALLDPLKFLVIDNAQHRRPDLMGSRTALHQIGEWQSVGQIVVPGFIAKDRHGDPVTLGRDGSDYSAAIIGALVQAQCVEIWTDVQGIHSADPRKIPSTRVWSHLDYNQASLIARCGGHVLHADTMAPLRDLDIEVRVRHSGMPFTQYTRIHKSHAGGKPTPTIAVSPHRVALGIRLGKTATLNPAKLLCQIQQHAPYSLAESSQHSVTLILRDQDLADVRRWLRSLPDAGAIHVSLLGRGSQVAVTGISQKPLAKIAQAANIHCQSLICSSDGPVQAALVTTEKAARLAEILHQNIVQQPHFNVILLGCGAVGKALLQQWPGRDLDARLIGVARSRRMLRSAYGIAPEFAHRFIDAGERYDGEALVAWALAQNRPLVVIDATASVDVAQLHADWLQQGIHVVTANKLAVAASDVPYEKLQNAITKSPSSYHYETTVGAALPVIRTARRLQSDAACGRIQLEAVVSGSLAYLFNGEAGESIADRLQQAIDMGYCEPDPREDLSGNDVGRKLLTIARTLQIPCSSSHVAVESLLDEWDSRLPRDQWLGQNQNFCRRLEERRIAAQKVGKKLQFIAEITPDGLLRAGLKALPVDHPLANLKGTENMFCFSYADNSSEPVVIRGPGAGPDVTAGGLLNDLADLLDSRRKRRFAA